MDVVKVRPRFAGTADLCESNAVDCLASSEGIRETFVEDRVVQTIEEIRGEGIGKSNRSACSAKWSFQLLLFFLLLVRTSVLNRQHCRKEISICNDRGQCEKKEEIHDDRLICPSLTESASALPFAEELSARLG